MSQGYSSANTSINSAKLPAVVKHINWEAWRGQRVLDFGGGKFDNLKEFLKAEYNVKLYVYDKFNRTDDENKIAITCNPQLIICSNVLNVIDSDKALKEVIADLHRYKKTTVYYIYEGDGSGAGSPTKKDCYQRNMKTEDHLRYFKGIPAKKVKKNIIEVNY